jgi:hypothetical protein
VQRLGAAFNLLVADKGAGSCIKLLASTLCVTESLEKFFTLDPFSPPFLRY